MHGASHVSSIAAVFAAASSVVRLHPMRGSKVRSASNFLRRRRARQAGGRSSRAHAYTLELAALHLQLLVAMAAVDEEVRQVEVEEVLAFIDRPSLNEDDLAKLEQLARTALAAPPSFDALAAELSKFATRPATARLVVDDLARVAAADQREDPRETRMLDAVCDALSLERMSIRIEPSMTGATSGPGRSDPAPEPRGPSIVAQRRARSAVRHALEASYRDEDERGGAS
jgi:uncharacterized tellurite resistance protein B-like protein